MQLWAQRILLSDGMRLSGSCISTPQYHPLYLVIQNQVFGGARHKKAQKDQKKTQSQHAGETRGQAPDVEKCTS
ncbi:hypothetical protein NDU88_004035 [Pleurodeles waltl]|uniref:Uncharacterized protein n=1 Tax=Pleurodeles waltl TaxID=8319 RepID=A0AAV7W7V1_PLEWA|nr:hypothetical protein NDU88_004035 [Pleurodeles waltl]